MVLWTGNGTPRRITAARHYMSASEAQLENKQPQKRLFQNRSILELSKRA